MTIINNNMNDNLRPLTCNKLNRKSESELKHLLYFMLNTINCVNFYDDSAFVLQYQKSQKID